MRCAKCRDEARLLVNGLCYKCNENNQNGGKKEKPHISEKDKPVRNRGWYIPKNSPGENS